MQYLSDFDFCLYELFPAFICANTIGSLVKDLFGVKIFISFPSFASWMIYQQIFLYHLLVVYNLTF